MCLCVCCMCLHICPCVSMNVFVHMPVSAVIVISGLSVCYGLERLYFMIV